MSLQQLIDALQQLPPAYRSIPVYMADGEGCGLVEVVIASPGGVETHECPLVLLGPDPLPKGCYPSVEMMVKVKTRD